MQAIEKEVLLQEGFTEADLFLARDRFSDSPEVKSLVASTRQMLDDALSGLEPVLAGSQGPVSMTDDALVV